MLDSQNKGVIIEQWILEGDLMMLCLLANKLLEIMNLLPKRRNKMMMAGSANEKKFLKGKSDVAGFLL